MNFEIFFYETEVDTVNILKNAKIFEKNNLLNKKKAPRGMTGLRVNTYFRGKTQMISLYQILLAINIIRF